MTTIILYLLVCGCIMLGTALDELDKDQPMKCLLVILYCFAIGGVMVPMLIGVLLDKYIEKFKD